MMKMNEKQSKIVKLLWDFDSLKEEHIIKYCNCDISDIDTLVGNNILDIDERTRIVRYKKRNANNRNIAAFDVVMRYLNRNAVVYKGNKWVNVSMKADTGTYDILAITENEISYIFQRIDEISKADKIIIVIQTAKYVSKEMNTKRPYAICTYSPLKEVEIKNN